ncbi:MAG: hypothetical protein ACLQVL_36740 [Terriglobia bacterium]
MTIWALATDGDADGTVASVYTDEKQMYLDLAERMGTEEEQEQAKNFSADIEALKEFVSEIEPPFLFTYSIDEREIEVPTAIVAAVLKARFSWLGTDEEADGADVVEALSDWYENLTTEPGR